MIASLKMMMALIKLETETLYFQYPINETRRESAKNKTKTPKHSDTGIKTSVPFNARKHLDQLSLAVAISHRTVTDFSC